MTNMKRMWHILKRTGTMKMLITFIIFLCAAAIALTIVEPEINGPAEGFYFCFVAAATIGFGDIAPVTLIGRIITIAIGIYGILMTAMVPGVIVSYYMEYLKTRENETISKFLEKLEILPELSREELESLSERVKQFNKKK